VDHKDDVVVLEAFGSMSRLAHDVERTRVVERGTTQLVADPVAD
jgi:hypothetical protein